MLTSFKLPFSLALSIFSLNAFAEAPLLAGGSNASAGGLLIARSTDFGDSWVPARKITGLPANLQQNMAGLVCRGEVCYTASYYKLSNNKWGGAILVSEDKGVNWHTVNIANMPAHTGQSISSIECSKTLCVAAGNYSHDGSISPMMLLGDTNEWHFVTKLNYPKDVNYYGGRVSCTDDYCVVASQYEQAPGIYYPIFSQYDRRTGEWQITKDIQGFPKDFKGLTLPDVSCTGSRCVATGGSGVFSSTDEGKTWSYVSTVAGSPAYQSIDLTTTYCKEDRCIAAGDGKLDNKLQPFLMHSKDGGQAWAYADIAKPVTPKAALYVTTSSCDKEVCVATGSTLKADPLVLISRDAGASWSYVENLPRVPNGGYALVIALQAATVQGQNIVIVGSSTDSKASLPLILVSHDAGATWDLSTKVTGVNGNDLYLYQLTGATSAAMNAKGNKGLLLK